MLLMDYKVDGVEPIGTWSPELAKAHIDFQIALNRELAGHGELVAAEALQGPETARVVTFDGHGPPVVSDGPFPESKEFLAGYRIVDVASRERAIEIAAQASAAPGPDGLPTKQEIEVRPFLTAVNLY